MGFFKEFKDDFSQAVNDLMPEEEEKTAEKEVEADDMVVNTLDDELDTQSELSKLNGLLEQVAEPVKEKTAPVKLKETILEKNLDDSLTRQAARKPDMEKISALTRARSMEERKTMSEETMKAAPVNERAAEPAAVVAEVSDETTSITEGTSIRGDLSSTGSIDISGRVNGNVQCNGKLIVTGILEGNSNSSEFFADAAKIEGEVNSTGTVKIGIGSVVIGNIAATSAVIAGAIKGDIDVQGPVVVDTSAVVMGNIKSRSVQINNGAVIEGFCSQCYADIDVQGLFDGQEGN